MSLNSALATAGRSLEVFSTGIEVAGQNISNANTPGYIRESLRLTSAAPYQQGNLILGTGVRADGVVQQIDRYLEVRIHGANTEYAASSARESIYKQLEAEINELGDSDLSTALNDFVGSINEVINQPELAGFRQIAVQQGQELAGDIRSLRQRVDNVREAQTVNVESLVAEANRLIDQIKNLNPQIAKAEAAGLLKSDAGGLRTQRYNALNRLSEIIPIRYSEREDGSVDIFTSSDYLLLSGQAQHLETTFVVDRGVKVAHVQLSQTKSNLSTAGGELRGIIDGRDNILGGFVDELDQYTGQLISAFNRIHSSGEGLKGFNALTSTDQVDDVTAALNSAGLSFGPTHGSFQLKVTNSQTGATTTTAISIDLDGIGADTTLENLRDSLNAIGNVSASITSDRRLVISADAQFEFRFSNDTSGVLAGLGLNTFFTGDDSLSINVNELVAKNHAYFAASQGGGPADGSNAIRLAKFTETPIGTLGGVSLDDYYKNIITQVAQSSASESAIAQGFAGFRESLLSQREQFSGVSLDEEALKVIQFQRAYQSAARLISIIDELFSTLLSI